MPVPSQSIPLDYFPEKLACLLHHWNVLMTESLVGPKLFPGAKGRPCGLLPGSRVGWRSRPPGDPLEPTPGPTSRRSPPVDPSLSAEPSPPCSPCQPGPRPTASTPQTDPHAGEAPAHPGSSVPAPASPLPRGWLPALQVLAPSLQRTGFVQGLLDSPIWQVQLWLCCPLLTPRHDLERGTPSSRPFAPSNGKWS